jgi:hypothetical protein
MEHEGVPTPAAVTSRPTCGKYGVGKIVFVNESRYHPTNCSNMGFPPKHWTEATSAQAVHADRLCSRDRRSEPAPPFSPEGRNQLLLPTPSTGPQVRVARAGIRPTQARAALRLPASHASLTCSPIQPVTQPTSVDQLALGRKHFFGPALQVLRAPSAAVAAA